jgi:hypothetical protein
MRIYTLRYTIATLVLLLLVRVGQSDVDGQRETPSSATDPINAAGIVIVRQVISSGATYGTSMSYRFDGTLGQPAIGEGSSVSYRFVHGFWQVYQGGCCVGIRGNIDNDSEDQVNIADLTYLVDYLFRGGSPPECEEEGDVNSDGNINIADLTYLVDYLFRGGSPPPPCP